MRIRNIITVALVVANLTSCMTATQIAPTETIAVTATFTPVPTEQLIEPGLEQEIQIKLGESVTLERGNLTIKFKSLMGDSRCPQGVDCVWQGNAEVILEVSNTEISLNTALEPKEKVVGQYNIQLQDVLPYPKAGEEYQPEDYRIKIIISKS